MRIRFISPSSTGASSRSGWQAPFAASAWFGQRRYLGSAIWSEAPGERFEALSGSAEAVASQSRRWRCISSSSLHALRPTLPAQTPALSLYADEDDAEWTRIDHEAREALRLDALLRTRDGELREQGRSIDELKAMVAHRDDVIAGRIRAEADLRAQFDDALDRERAAHDAQCQRLMRAIDAQERIVAYRESVRWWFVLPLLRARRLWNRIRAA